MKLLFKIINLLTAILSMYFLLVFLTYTLGRGTTLSFKHSLISFLIPGFLAVSGILNYKFGNKKIAILSLLGVAAFCLLYFIVIINA